MTGRSRQIYSIHIFHGLAGVDPRDVDVDVEVRFDDGGRYAATFFTLDNLRALFAKNQRTGECAGGLYLWAANMIVLVEVTEVAVAETVAALIAAGEFEGAFGRLT